MLDEPPPLSSLECMDDAYGARLQLENPSDAIFAGLFLQDGGISWSSFDTLLSAIRNTSFDSRQVTFKDSTDFASRIATIRERNLMRQRTPEVQISGIPEVVLEGAVDALGDELAHNLDLARKESYGYIPYDFYLNSFPELFESWKVTLINCTLVHSTWLAPARRALGRCHLSTIQLLPRSVRSPWIGTWTQEVHLRIRCESFPSNSPVFRPLFARLPHLRRLQFISHLGGFAVHNTESSLLPPSFFEALHLLPSLTELAFNVSDDVPTSLIQMLASTPLPNLKILRFLEMSLYNFGTLNLPHQFSPIVTAFPSLHAIHFDAAAKSFPSVEMTGIIWEKISGNAPVMSGPAEFSPSYVRACITNYPRSEDYSDWRRWRSSLPAVQKLHCICFCDRCYYNYSEPPVASELRDILALCTSLRFLSVFMGVPETGVASVMGHIPHTVEELEFTFPTLVDDLFAPSEEHPLSAIEEWDADLVRALRAETSPRLHTFRAYFSRRTVEIHANDMHMDAYGSVFRRLRAEDEEHHEEDSIFITGPLLPRCQNVCEERGIQFSMETLILLS